jgi:hypothetical protein
MLYTKVIHKSYTQKLYTKATHKSCIKTHTQNQTKVVHKSCTEKLYTKAVQKIYTEKLYTKVAHKSCIKKHINSTQNQTKVFYTKVIHKSHTQRLYSKAAHKTQQKLYTKAAHKSHTQKLYTKEKLHRKAPQNIYKNLFFTSKTKKADFFPVKIRKSKLFCWIFIQENIQPKSDFLTGTARCPTGEPKYHVTQPTIPPPVCSLFKIP